MQLTPYSDSVSLRLHLQRLNLATHRNSAAHYARGTISGFTIALYLFVSTRFQDSISLPLSGFFSPFPHGTGTLSVSKEYLDLEGGPPRFRQGSTCPVLLRIPAQFHRFRIRDFHSLWCDFPDTSSSNFPLMQVLQPQYARILVWSNLRSLAATCRISIDFSSWRYLDVSVPSVRFLSDIYTLI
jgi:hypothetical protein